jgi:hypothetical protein
VDAVVGERVVGDGVLQGRIPSMPGSVQPYLLQQ